MPALLILILFVGVRALLVFSAADVFFYGEELAKAAAAKAMLDGLPVAHYELQYVFHEGGGFVVSHLEAAMFWLVGESLLAVKLVALLVSSSLLMVGMGFTREFFGTRASIVFGILFTLCPEVYLRFSLLSLGTHFEALIFVTLVLRYAFRIARKDGCELLDWAKLGLTAGFGLYFSLQLAPAIAVAGACIVVGLRGRAFGRGLAVAVACALAGAMPLVMTLRNVGLDAFRVRGEALVGAHGTGPFDSIRDLFTPLAQEGSLLDWTVLGLVPALIAWGLPALRERRQRLVALGILAYLTLFLTLYACSGLAVGMNGHWFLYLRTSSLWFFATLLAAVALDVLLDRLAVAASVALLVLLLAGIVDVIGLSNTGRPGQWLANARLLATTKGYDYAEFLAKFLPRLPADDNERVRVVMSYDDDSSMLPSALANAMFEKSSHPHDFVLNFVRRSFGDRAPQAMLGLGHYLHPDQGYDVSAAFRTLDLLPESERPRLAEALGRAGLGPRFRRDRLDEQVRTPVPAAYREAWLRGSGMRVHMAYRLDPIAAHTFLAAQTDDVRPALEAGYEASRVERALP